MMMIQRYIIYQHNVWWTWRMIKKKLYFIRLRHKPIFLPLTLKYINAIQWYLQHEYVNKRYSYTIPCDSLLRMLTDIQLTLIDHKWEVPSLFDQSNTFSIIFLFNLIKSNVSLFELSTLFELGIFFTILYAYNVFILSCRN
jgi:hypothetical protein